MTPDKFQELLARAKALAAARAGEASIALSGYDKLSETVTSEKPHTIDLSAAGVSDTSLATDEGEAAAVDVIQELGEIASVDGQTIDPAIPIQGKDAGVARKVTLNDRQQSFVTTLLSGEDCCLIGAAGTGKTTCTGAAIQELVASGKLQPTGSSTKWLQSGVSGVLITSFTRKAVNNIRRATPDSLKPHVLTLHKVLEFQPEFSEIEDPANPGEMKKTMAFIPARTRLNPLPSGLTHVFFEESSMIGTDLYNLFLTACPHQPQEIFIGDIRQLPPIFGPAILGFKMALLPIIELNEVYRQALKSPIIRLAHAILSGDSSKFDPTVVTTKQRHPQLKDKIVEYKSVPSLQTYEEHTDEGIVRLQIWQKTLPEDVACNTMIQQFIRWEQEGYYRPDDDLILCSFNKGFGTLEINKGIHNHLSLKRAATIHEIIAGFNTHYYAVGDRVLYDKEDAFITDIKRNISYLGKSPRPASIHLDRWGAYQKPLTEEQLSEAKDQEVELSNETLETMFDSFSDSQLDASGDDKRVQAASHEVTIRFAYSEEVLKLTGAAEINNLLGGHAITVHKAQGSENQAIFLCLHKSHNVMLSSELLYTAVSRARFKLHVICEIDSFQKAVKTHRVRGQTLEDKIKFFQGKVEFSVMEEEMKFLKLQKKMKQDRLTKEKLLEKTETQLETQDDAGQNIVNFPAPSSNSVGSPSIDTKPANDVVATSPARPLSLAERLAALRATVTG